MKRKNFIQSSIGALTASYLPALPKFQTIEDEALFVSPAFLKAGDIIGTYKPGDMIELLMFQQEEPVNPRKYLKCN